MTRPNNSSRTTDKQDIKNQDAPEDLNTLPTFKDRKPFMYWCLMIGVGAMVLTMMTSFIYMIFSGGNQ